MMLNLLASETNTKKLPVEKVAGYPLTDVAHGKEPTSVDVILSEGKAHATTDLVRLYLQDIGRVPLLGKEEEIAIARKVQRYLALLEVQQQAVRQGDKVLAQFANLMAVRDRLATQSGSSPSLNTWAKASNIEPISLKQVLAKGKRQWAKVAGLEVAELERIEQAGIRAKEKMIAANLRLVVSIAKKYQNRGMELLDLIQEGTLGLERAAEKFDPAQGCRFSTYAYWWIRQGITRAIASQSRLIRLPVHVTEKINKIKQAQRQISQEKGRPATLEELAELLKMTAPQIRQILLKIPRSVSLEIKVGKEQDTELADLLESEEATPEEIAVTESLRRDVKLLLAQLNPREREVMQLRYGFKDGTAYSLADIGQTLNLSRERVRQIEVRALQKLRHPRRRTLVEDYVEALNE